MKQTPPAAAPLYEERVSAPLWIYFLLSTPLGIVLALGTGFAVTGALDGVGATIFYSVIAVVAATLVLLLVNFMTLRATVEASGLSISLGVFRKRFSAAQVKTAETSAYSWLAYGGWGVRYSSGGRRAWSIPGVKRGVIVAADEEGNARAYFISSGHPEELAAAVNRLVKSG